MISSLARSCSCLGTRPVVLVIASSTVGLAVAFGRRRAKLLLLNFVLRRSDIEQDLADVGVRLHMAMGLDDVAKGKSRVDHRP